MLDAISWFVIIFITYIVDCYVFSKIIGVKFKFNLKCLFLIILASIINCYFKMNYTAGIRNIVTNLELVILLKTLYGKSVLKTIIAVFFIFVGYALSEVIFALIVGVIMGLNLDFFTTMIGELIVNIAIIIIFLLIMNLKAIRMLIKNIMDWSKDNEFINTILLVVIGFTTFIALTYPMSHVSNPKQTTFIYAIFFFSAIVFVPGFFKQKTENNELSVEYDYLLEYVKDYEKELDDKSKKQHEYKNQLIILKGLLNSKNKKAEKYIDDLIEDGSMNDDETLLNSLKNVPDGGLKGLIYFKLLRLKGTKAEVHINVDSKLSNKRLWKSCVDNLRDISKIVGVFLDNAVEALNNEKDKYLIIDIDYEDKNIVFTFSNTCTKHIDFTKMDQEGYSTKGKNHGYGLSLVQDIVNNNPLLETKKEINGRFFVQHLYVHTKK